MYYHPKRVRQPRVHHTLFGPIGRKWLDLHGLEGRFKIAQGPESLDPPEPKTDPVRKKPSGDLNAAPKPPEGDMGEPSRFRQQTGPMGTEEEGWGDAPHTFEEVIPGHPTNPDTQKQPSIDQEIESFEPPREWERGMEVPDEFEPGGELLYLEGADDERGSIDHRLLDLLEAGAPEDSAILDWVKAYLGPQGLYDATEFDSKEEYVDKVVSSLMEKAKRRKLLTPDQMGELLNIAREEAEYEWSKREGVSRDDGGGDLDNLTVLGDELSPEEETARGAVRQWLKTSDIPTPEEGEERESYLARVVSYLQDAFLQNQPINFIKENKLSEDEADSLDLYFRKLVLEKADELWEQEQEFGLDLDSDTTYTPTDEVSTDKSSVDKELLANLDSNIGDENAIEQWVSSYIADYLFPSEGIPSQYDYVERVVGYLTRIAQARNLLSDEQLSFMQQAAQDEAATAWEHFEGGE